MSSLSAPMSLIVRIIAKTEILPWGATGNKGF